MSQPMYWENIFSDIMTMMGLISKMDIEMTQQQEVNSLITNRPSAWLGNFSIERCKC